MNRPTVTFTRHDPSVIQAATDDYRILLAPINQVSDDDRVFVGSVGWRDSVPLMFSDSEQAHEDARYVGSIVDIGLEMIGEVQWAVGHGIDWDSSEWAQRARQLADQGRFNGTSVHIGKGRFADVCPTAGGFQEIAFPEGWVIEEVDGVIMSIDPPCDPLLLGIFEAEIAASSIVAVPAFPDARIVKEGVEPIAASNVPVASEGLEVTPFNNIIFNNTIESDSQPWASFTHMFYPKATTAGDVLRAAIASLDRPPRTWFENQNLDGATPITVTDEGQVFGHLALWDTCHTGFQGRCVQVPKQADYSMFLTARVFADDGARIPCGPLVVDDGHAPAFWTIEKVSRYYADTRLAAAYVTVGEDDHGVWVAGSVSHKATSGQIETLRRHALSGDWRKTDGVTRLVAAVSVNGPGFIVPEVLAASGEEVGLVTYGPEPITDKPSDLGLVYSALVRLTELIEGKPELFSTELTADPALDAVDEETEDLDAHVAFLLDSEELEATVQAALIR